MGTLIYGAVGVLDAAAGMQPDVAVYVEGNRIAAAGTFASLRAQYPDAALAGGRDYCLLPAFINSHDHGRAFGTASLGVPDDLLEIWLPQLGGGLMPAPYLAGAWEGAQLLKSGVSSVAHSHNPPDWGDMLPSSSAMLRGYRAAGIRVAFHPPIVDQNPLVYADEAAFLAGLPAAAQAQAQRFLQPVPLTTADYLQVCAALVAQYHDVQDHTVHVQLSPAGGQWCSDALILACVDFARQQQTRVQMHMLETRYQHIYALKTWGKSFIQHLDDIGALGDWMTFAHMVYLSDADIALLAERGAGVSHNPSSNLRLRSGIAPAAKLLAAGVRTGIGLDGHTLDDDHDYLREMRLAYVLGNRPGAASLPLAHQTVLQMGTQGGASVTFGAGAPLGHLAPGMLADLVLLDWQAVRGRWSPEGYPALPDALGFLLHRAAQPHIRHVMVNGAWVVREGRCITLDEDALADEIRLDLARQLHASGRADLGRAAQSLAPYLRRFYAGWDQAYPLAD